MKLSLLKTLSLGVAVGAISLCNVAQAQTDTTTTTTTMSTTSSAMAPMPVSGTVLRYYVNRAGFVTAMDVQTAEGIRMVRFAPSMAQNLTSMYPVGSTASVYVTSSMSGGMTRYDLAGVGTDMPSPTAMMMPMMVSDVDLLKAEPYTLIGAQQTRYTGNLSGYISDPMNGEILAIILDNKTLVRVPRENRLVQASVAPVNIAPMMKGADVVVYGVPEAPRFGAVSPYENRVIASGIAVNGRALGPFGFGRMQMGRRDTLLGFNVPVGGNLSTEENAAMGMGYSTYMVPGTMAPNGMNGAMGGGTTGGM